MLFQLPDHQQLYEAFVRRDARYEGRVFVGVSSTGIFCRLTCSARKPKAENCQFYESVGECLNAGLRPCKRCHPLQSNGDVEPAVKTLLSFLEDDPARRWREQDISALGFDPSTVRRIFKRHYGMTFLEMARLCRLRAGFQALSAGASVIDAQLEAGFDSSSGFRDAFAKLLGQAPSALKREGLLQANWIETPVGPMIAVADKSHLHLLEFADRKGLASELKKLWAGVKGALAIGRPDPIIQVEAQLAAYFGGESGVFSVPLVLHGSDFEKTVWRQLEKIPPGETRSYRDVAQALGRPSACRAVARANGANQLALVIPCHRVIGADGSLTGYAGGLWRKRYLLELEQKLATRAGL